MITFLLSIACLALIVAAYVVIEQLRQILDVLRLIAAQGSERRGWKREGER